MKRLKFKNNMTDNFFDMARLLGVPAEQQQHFSDNCARIWRSMIGQCSGGSFADWIAEGNWDKAYNTADSTNTLLIEHYKQFWHLMIYPANIAIQAAKFAQDAEVQEGWKRVKKCLDVLEAMAKEGFEQVPKTGVPGSALPYVTESGKEFYHGEKELPNDLYPFRISAAFCLLPEDMDENATDKDFILTKEDLREIGTAIGHEGYRRYVLYTNYGVELHSEENPSDFGINIITKICKE